MVLEASEVVVLGDIMQVKFLQSMSPLTDVDSKAVQLQPICHLLILKVNTGFLEDLQASRRHQKNCVKFMLVL